LRAVACYAKAAPGHRIYPYLLRGIAIGMDGKGRWCDNVFVERFWKSIKSVQEARAKIGGDIDFYNTTRPHSSLNTLTPDQVYFNRPPEALAA
jgi:putative transposase